MSPLKTVDKFSIQNKKLCAVENFLENPDIYREFMLEHKDKYKYPIPDVDFWVGFRFTVTDHPLVKHPLIKSLYKELSKVVLPEFNMKPYTSEWGLAFHYAPKISQDLVGDFFKQYSLHKDTRSICAGVIYMTPNAPEDTGTIFLDDENTHSIDNVYNRMIFYDSSITHAPQNLFGETIEDSRLTITFFFWNKEPLDVKRFYMKNNNDIYNL